MSQFNYFLDSSINVSYDGTSVGLQVCMYVQGTASVHGASYIQTRSFKRYQFICVLIV